MGCEIHDFVAQYHSILRDTQGFLMTEPQRKASTAKQYTVTQQDLPLSCPMPDMELWDSHPKIYMPIEEKGQCTCPYCGAEYVLAPEKHASKHA